RQLDRHHCLPVVPLNDGCRGVQKVLNALPLRGRSTVISFADLASRGCHVQGFEGPARRTVDLHMTIEHGADALIEPVSPGLVSQITGRSRSLFHADMERNREALSRACASARVLVIGASGSIGGAVIKLLASIEPAALTLVDLNENSLAD